MLAPWSLLSTSVFFMGSTRCHRVCDVSMRGIHVSEMTHCKTNCLQVARCILISKHRSYKETVAFLFMEFWHFILTCTAIRSSHRDSLYCQVHRLTCFQDVNYLPDPVNLYHCAQEHFTVIIRIVKLFFFFAMLSDLGNVAASSSVKKTIVVYWIPHVHEHFFFYSFLRCPVLDHVHLQPLYVSLQARARIGGREVGT